MNNDTNINSIQNNRCTKICDVCFFKCFIIRVKVIEKPKTIKKQSTKSNKSITNNTFNAVCNDKYVVG